LSFKNERTQLRAESKLHVYPEGVKERGKHMSRLMHYKCVLTFLVRECLKNVENR
jgi:hypothetical protein